MLRSMRHAMGGDLGLLCHGLSQRALPLLCQAVSKEAESGHGEGNWHAAQALFSTLSAVLPAVAPSAGDVHPAVSLWKVHWKYFEAAMLEWPLSATDEPAASAAQALGSAALALPEILPDAIQLIVRSILTRELPQVQLQ